MINMPDLENFIRPYYANKDIMHNMWHIELVRKTLDNILSICHYDICYDHLILAMYFHGFIYRDESKIRTWLGQQHYSADAIEHIVKIAWESQRSEIPETIEGKLLHDAHVLEGGKTYLVTKTLITGSLRGQSFRETLAFMKEHVLNQNRCYLPETIPLCEEMNRYTNEYFEAVSQAVE